ncbi:MAG: hypothetical protein ABI780_07730 [Ardenticatenales bacterium]
MSIRPPWTTPWSAAPLTDGINVPRVRRTLRAPALRDAIEWAARWLSRVASPPLVAIAALGQLAISGGGGGNGIGPGWLAAFAVPAVLAPALAVAALVRAGRVVDFDLSDRRQRHRPFALAVACAAVTALALARLSAPPALVQFGTAWTALLGALSLVTLRWKISLHAAAVGAAAGMDLAYGARHVVLWTALVLSVAIARIVLGRHSPRQVLAGAALGLAAGWLGGL